MSALLPSDFEARLAGAVAAFWSSQGARAGSSRQGGSRDQVLGGKNMDGFVELVGEIARHNGLQSPAFGQRARDVVLPGYFRSTKNWDALIVHHGRLIAAVEFKSQVGSFGNNLNNRTEEVLGTGVDFQAAYEEGAFRSATHHGGTFLRSPDSERPIAWGRDPRPPFTAWLMLLQDNEASRAPVNNLSPVFPVREEFRGASYADRYRLLCERLMERRLYTAASLMLSEEQAGTDRGAHSALSAATSARALFTELGARCRAAAEE